MIHFKKIRWKNFLSTGNYFTEILLDKSPNTLIVGTNGSGKSTMLDALCFALFGKAFRNINKPQLVNSINQKDCLTECYFIIGNKEYRIVRGIKPAVFEIYCDNVLLNQDAASRDYQEYLEKNILKLNYKSFTQIVILGSASFVPFMQLSAADRRSIIEDLLDIKIFSTMNSVLKDKLSLNKQDIADNKTKIELTQTKYDMQSSHINVLKTNTQDKIIEYEQEIQRNLSNIQVILSETSEFSRDVSEYQQSILNKDKVEKKLKSITKIESQIENTLSKCRNDLHFFQHSNSCPTCKQEIAVGVKEQQVETLGLKINETEEGLKELNKKYKEEQEKLNFINQIQTKIQDLQIKIASNNTAILETNKYVEKLRGQIESMKKKDESLDSEKINLDSLQKELNDLEENKKKLMEEKTYLEVANTLLKDTGIKTKIIKQYLPIINKIVNKYLSIFDFFVNFNLDESFKETIKSRHRDEFSYASFSEGEKQRIDMALMLTWRAIAKLKNSSNTNLLILDEVFDSSLDNNGTEYLMNILQMLENVNIFVISHKGDILQDKFRSIIKFDKVNNFSRISK